MYAMKIYYGYTSLDVIHIEGSRQMLLNINFSKSMDSPAGQFSAEFVPERIDGSSWIEKIPTYAFCEIWKIQGNVSVCKMVGMINWIGMSADVESMSIRYTVKGYDLGIFFTRFFNIMSNRYLQGDKASSATLYTTYISEMTKMLNIEAAKLDIYAMTPLLWTAFKGLFEKQLTVTGASPLKYRFLDGQTMDDKFGNVGQNFFKISQQLQYRYPLYVSLFREGEVTFWSVLQSWITDHYNEYWMDTCDGISQNWCGDDQIMSPPEKSFCFFARPALRDINVFNRVKPIYLPHENLVSFVLSKTSEEQYTIFIPVADGAYNVGGSMALNIPEYHGDAMRIFGNRVLESHIKNVYTGDKNDPKVASQDWNDPRIAQLKFSGEHLKRIYGNVWNQLSGTVVMMDVNVKIGQKFETQIVLGNGKKKYLQAIIRSLQEGIDYTSGTPKPLVTIQFYAGVLSELRFPTLPGV